MVSNAARALLVAVALTQANAEHPHDHDKEPCGCAQHEIDHPFTINCDDAAGLQLPHGRRKIRSDWWLCTQR